MTWEQKALVLLARRPMTVAQVIKIGGANLLNTMVRLTKRNLVQYKRGHYVLR